MNDEEEISLEDLPKYVSELLARNSALELENKELKDTLEKVWKLLGGEWARRGSVNMNPLLKLKYLKLLKAAKLPNKPLCITCTAEGGVYASYVPLRFNGTGWSLIPQKAPLYRPVVSIGFIDSMSYEESSKSLLILD